MLQVSEWFVPTGPSEGYQSDSLQKAYDSFSSLPSTHSRWSSVELRIFFIQSFSLTSATLISISILNLVLSKHSDFPVHKILTVLRACSSWNLTLQDLQVSFLPRSLSSNSSSLTFAPVISLSRVSVFLLRWENGLLTNRWAIGLVDTALSHSRFLLLILIQLKRWWSEEEGREDKITNQTLPSLQSVTPKQNGFKDWLVDCPWWKCELFSRICSWRMSSFWRQIHDWHWILKPWTQRKLSLYRYFVLPPPSADSHSIHWIGTFLPFPKTGPRVRNVQTVNTFLGKGM